MTNPLLTRQPLPPFSQIQAEHIEPAIDHILADNRSRVEEIANTAGERSWENLVQPLEEIEDVQNQAWSPVSHMNAVVNTDALRSAYNNCLPKLSEYETEMGQHEGLFKAFKSLSQSEAYNHLEIAQKKTIENALRDFRLSGIELSSTDKLKFGEIQKRLAELSSKFSDNVLDATQAWTRLVEDRQELVGLPESAISLAEQTAKQRGKEGYLLTLDYPCYQPLMTYCENRELRREIYEAYTTRASDKGPHAGKWDNTALITEILALRVEVARLLGFDNYAELSLATKMAASTEQVLSFLNDLAEKGYPIAAREYAEICEFAQTEFAMEELTAWDVGFYAEKLRLHKYNISQEEMRPYFPAPVVIKGMFEVVKRLYDIDVTQKSGWDVWHPDVKCYEIVKAGKIIAGFYLDLYARPGKRGGAWMDSCRVRRIQKHGELQLPVAYLTCNFTMPIGDQPALLTHDEVTTLFHEFGHGLHHMLTKVDYADVSGINGVAWDAVELPSQFHENWCWQPEALEFISAHHETGESLSSEMLDKMLAAKNFGAASQMMRQLEFGLFDFKLHMETGEEHDIDVQQILDQIREQVSVISVPEFNRFQNGFSHIFAGGYAAGYYSYKWAEVLSADAFSTFIAEGIFNRQTGERFLETVLEQGGARDPMDLFVEFVGREPEVDALLRQEGIKA
jgi:oligopeptidase A